VCVALLALLYVAGSFAAPLLEVAGLAGGEWLRLVYAPLCHQNPERSLAVGAGHQSVCARCSGLYLGGVAGLLVAAWLALTPRRRPHPLWLALAAAPTLIDVAISWVGLAGLPNLPRLFVAWPAGFVAGLFLAVGLSDLFSVNEAARVRERRSTMTPFALEESDG
jgi:uncharacterized membrane protein